MPDFSREAASGGLVAGLDEVGRGPLAGPVVAAALLFTRPPDRELAAGIDDSKRVSARLRLSISARLLASPLVRIGVGAASVAEIGRLNIRLASLLAMRRALARLGLLPDLALVDGNVAPDLPCPVRCVIGGDRLSLSIAGASIIAKVTRDRAMARLDLRYPAYGFARHAGYPTAAHRTALDAHGPCPHHRRGFGSVPAEPAPALP